MIKVPYENATNALKYTRALLDRDRQTPDVIAAWDLLESEHAASKRRLSEDTTIIVPLRQWTLLLHTLKDKLPEDETLSDRARFIRPTYSKALSIQDEHNTNTQNLMELAIAEGNTDHVAMLLSTKIDLAYFQYIHQQRRQEVILLNYFVYCYLKELARSEADENLKQLSENPKNRQLHLWMADQRHAVIAAFDDDLREGRMLIDPTVAARLRARLLTQMRCTVPESCEQAQSMHDQRQSDAMKLSAHADRDSAAAFNQFRQVMDEDHPHYHYYLIASAHPQKPTDKASGRFFSFFDDALSRGNPAVIAQFLKAGAKKPDTMSAIAYENYLQGLRDDEGQGLLHHLAKTGAKKQLLFWSRKWGAHQRDHHGRLACDVMPQHRTVTAIAILSMIAHAVTTHQKKCFGNHNINTLKKLTTARQRPNTAMLLNAALTVMLVNRGGWRPNSMKTRLAKSIGVHGIRMDCNNDASTTKIFITAWLAKRLTSKLGLTTRHSVAARQRVSRMASYIAALYAKRGGAAKAQMILDALFKLDTPDYSSSDEVDRTVCQRLSGTVKAAVEMPRLWSASTAFETMMSARSGMTPSVMMAR